MNRQTLIQVAHLGKQFICLRLNFIVIQPLPSLCTAFSQSFSVNSIQWRIWETKMWGRKCEGVSRSLNERETPSHFRLDHVTGNTLAAQNNKAGLLKN